MRTATPSISPIRPRERLAAAGALIERLLDCSPFEPVADAVTSIAPSASAADANGPRSRPRAS